VLSQEQDKKTLEKNPAKKGNLLFRLLPKQGRHSTKTSMLFILLAVVLSTAFLFVYANNNGCIIGCESDAACDDQNPDTTDICNNDGQCDSGCAYIHAELGCQVECSSDSQCDDHDPKTTDICNNDGTCQAECSNLSTQATEESQIEDRGQDFKPAVEIKNQAGAKGHFEVSKTLDGAFDIKITSPATEEEKPAPKMEIKSLKSATEKIDTKIDSYSGKEPRMGKINTPVVAVKQQLYFEEATITLPKTGPVNTIVRCSSFDFEAFNCQGWEETSIAFQETADTITFNVTGFSAYAGALIVITKAEHLDSNKEFISDVYQEVKDKDDLWSETILPGEYVRVTFERPLSRNNDITIYARSLGGEADIEIYPKDSQTLIASIQGISTENWFKTILTGLAPEESHSTFDLKVLLNPIEFDYIVDPAGSWSSLGDKGGALYSMATYDGNLFTGDGIGVLGTYNSTSNVWSYLRDEDGAIYSMAAYDGNLFTGDTAKILGTYNSTSNVWSPLLYTSYTPDSMAVYDGNLFTGDGIGELGTYNSTSRIWSSLGDKGTTLRSLAVYDGNLFTGDNDGVLGTYNSTSNVWSSLGDKGGALYSMATYDGNLFTGDGDGVLGTYNSTSRVWSSLGDKSSGILFSMVVNDGNLFTGDALGILGTYGPRQTPPTLTSISDAPDPIAGGSEITITPAGQGDTDSFDLYYYCNETGTPTSANTLCSQANTKYSPPYASMTCTYNVPVEIGERTVYCRVYTKEIYSDEKTTTYTVKEPNIPPDCNIWKVSIWDFNATLPSFSYAVDKNLTIIFRTSDADSDDLNFNMWYDTSTGGKTNKIIGDINLSTEAMHGNCDTNSKTGMVCTWDWNIMDIADNNYWITTEINDGTDSNTMSGARSFKVNPEAELPANMDVNVTHINGYEDAAGLPTFSYANDGNLTFDFNFATGTNYGTHYADINYSTANTQGSGTSIVTDLLIDGNLCQTNFVGDWNNQPNSDANLVSYWKYDAQEDDFNTSRAFDYSGSENHGQYIGGADNNAEGKWDTNAGFFDGVDDYIEVAHSNSLNIAEAVTLITWLYDPSNWLFDWAYRKKITIDQTKVDDSLTDFPVLLKLTSTNFDFSKSNADGFDIRFTSSDGETLLKYERERHDSGNSLAEYWVKVPSVSGTADTNIYIYYQTADTADGADPTNVWDADFVGVWHLAESGNGTTGEFKDSTSNENDGTGGATAGGEGDTTKTPNQTTGAVGHGQAFTAANTDRIDLGNPAELDFGTGDWTVESWINHANENATQETVYAKGGDNAGGIRYAIALGEKTGAVQRLTLTVDDNDGKYQAEGTADFCTATWVYAVGLRNGANIFTYLNAVQDATIAVGAAYSLSETSQRDAYIGCITSQPDATLIKYANMSIDEVRISAIARSAAWMKASYNSGNNTLLAYGEEETPVTGRVVLGKGRDAYQIEIDDDLIVRGYINGTEQVSSQITKAWHHIALTYDGSNVRLYIDGTDKNSAALASAITTNASNLKIGELVSGKMEETRIYNRALTANEISLGYNLSVRNHRKCSWDWDIQNIADDNYFALINTRDGSGNEDFEASDYSFHVNPGASPADTCSCPSSGNWEIDDGSICTLNTECNLTGGDLHISSGSLNIAIGGTLVIPSGHKIIIEKAAYANISFSGGALEIIK